MIHNNIINPNNQQARMLDHYEGHRPDYQEGIIKDFYLYGEYITIDYLVECETGRISYWSDNYTTGDLNPKDEARLFDEILR